MNKKVIVSLAVGVLISAVALYFAFRNVPFSELAVYIGSVNYLWVIPSVILSLISFVFRTFRWQTILNSEHTVNFQEAFHPLMISFMLNSILPGRLGEVSRPIILSRRSDISFSTGLATVAVERIFDVSMLLLMFAGTLSMVHIDPQFQMTFGKYQLNRSMLMVIGKSMVFLGLGLLTVIVLLNVKFIQDMIRKVILFLPERLPLAKKSFKDRMVQKISLPMIRIMDNIVSGFSMIRQPKRIYACLIYSLIVWGLQAASFYVMSLGCPGIHLSLTQMTAVMVIICFFIALPSVPGFWGLWEAGAIFAMSLFGVALRDAAGFTLTNHAIQFFPVIIVGIVSFFKIGADITQITPKKGISHGNS